MKVVFKKELLEGLLDYAKDAHPNEVIVLLRGKRKEDEIYIDTVVIPPFSYGGVGFSAFNPYMLPADASIVGSAHSHPSGVKRPSVQDLLHAYGIVVVIVGYPYRDIRLDIAVYDKEGKPLKFEAR
jgi:proteasome lid subunit RPN8/RPN11